jgi:UDP-GlcNAc:undecaprenyl-phosphate/decaprenyl-phosphate GlcNAc-1-phosphate transferase
MPGIAAFLSFLVTVLFMFALRPVAFSVRLVDVPGGRKRQGITVPVIGGIAMGIGLATGTTLVGTPPSWTPVLIGVALLIIVGAIDDRFDLPANVRLIAQSCAALLVVFASGIEITHLGEFLGYRLILDDWGVPFTILLVITLVNAFNLIDGLDGLAGGLALLGLTIMALLGLGAPLFPLATVAASVVAGYLLFNLPLGVNRVVRTFMGDAGSTALGLIIAAVGIDLTQGMHPVVSPSIGLWFVAVPVFDLFASIVRRLLNRRSPFKPDHGHLHHVLVDGGLSGRATLIVILGLAVLYSAIGLVGDMLAIDDAVMLLLWFAAGVAHYQMQRFPQTVIAPVAAFRRIFSPEFVEQLTTEDEPASET